ncbi:hypothetical protein [Nocardioides sp.]|uniref:hypothetical protein n=1 Tax=Nocardioides sp. TaxID=35761 RepID=UPI002C435E95|nr:hypothetical protein [Nocardioides sp.]HXH81076.1 hypothetical protein [Nocardioides sp.]
MQRLVAAGYQAHQADPTTFLAGVRRAVFRWRWGFTRLHTFVLFGRVEHATGDHVREFTALALRWAEQAKGGMPRGFQTGAAVLPVLVCNTADASALEQLNRRPAKRFALFELPMLVDLSQGRWATYTGRMRWGGVYQDFLRAQQQLVVGDLDGDAPDTKGAGRRAVMSVVMSVAMAGMILFGVGYWFVYRLFF